MVSDKGHQYTSHHFANIARNWDFKQIINKPAGSPGFSQSINGMAKLAVKTLKLIIARSRAKKSKTDVYLPGQTLQLLHNKAKYEEQPNSNSDELAYEDTSAHNRQSAGADTDTWLALFPTTQRQQTTTSVVLQSISMPRNCNLCEKEISYGCKHYESTGERMETGCRH